MEGGKYNKKIINHIKILSNSDNTEKILNVKRKVCILVNGQPKNEQNIFKSILRNELDIESKPKCVRSAVAIFLLIKYPHFRGNNSFINIVIKSNLTEEFLKIALDVLTVDKECIDFITNCDKIFNSEIVVTNT